MDEVGLLAGFSSVGEYKRVGESPCVATAKLNKMNTIRHLLKRKWYILKGQRLILRVRGSRLESEWRPFSCRSYFYRRTRRLKLNALVSFTLKFISFSKLPSQPSPLLFAPLCHTRCAGLHCHTYTYTCVYRSHVSICVPTFLFSLFNQKRWKVSLSCRLLQGNLFIRMS